MARRLDKEKAIKLRLKGFSYSQIKQEMGISKSTLSGWLADYPLSKTRIRELRDVSPKRIENYKRTVVTKREKYFEEVYEKVKKDICKLNKRDLFLAGLFLYWGEGSKTERYTTAMSNTDPDILKYFLLWLELMKIPKNKISIDLQIYADMNKNTEINFWSNTLCLPKTAIRSVRVKKSNLSGLTYKKGFNHGTCHVKVYNRDLKDYILMSLKYLRQIPRV